MAFRRLFPTVHPLLIAQALTLAAGFLLLSSYQDHLNIDAISYVSVARKYAAGHFHEALSFYWSPMLSWLLALLLKLGADPLAGVRALLVVAAACAVGSVWMFCRMFPLLPAVRAAVLAMSVPLLLSFAFAAVTPDLLFLAVVFLYLALIFDERYLRRWWSGVACGIIGALGYLCKGYGLPLFLSHFLLLSVLWAAVSPQQVRRVALHAVLGIMSFAVVAAPWVTVLSMKLGRFTVGETANVSHAIDGPLNPVMPMYGRGLLPPPDPLSVSIWDEPASIERVEWVPWESAEAFTRQVKIVLINLMEVVKRVPPVSWFLPVAVAAYVVLAAPFRFDVLRKRRLELFCLLTLLLDVLVFLPFLIEVRYLWIAVVMVLPIGGHLLSLAFVSPWMTRPRRLVALVLFALSVLTLPFWETAFNFDDGRIFAQESRLIGERYRLAGKRLASDYWKSGLFFSYYVGGRYYGQPKHRTNARHLEEELLTHRIDSYVAWSEVPEGLQAYKLTETGVGGIRLLERKSL